MITRNILPQLEKELATKEIVVITGMRQVGKTTILKYLFDQVQSDNKALIDLENPLNRKIFEEENYDNIWQNLRPLGITSNQPAHLFLDEIQHLPTLPVAVKYLYDHWQVKFFLTGSSSYYLKNLFAESLSSRKIVYELFPLTFQEFLIFKSVQSTTPDLFKHKADAKNKTSYQRLIKWYDEYMTYGGFPAVVLETDSERKHKLLQQVFTSYFEIDVKSLADFRELSKLRDLILLLIPRIGSKLDIGRIANELGVSRETIYNYLTFLEQTYFITLIPQFSHSIDRQAAGAKKLFLCDSGLANILGRLSLGQLLEQTVFQTLRSDHQLTYFYKQNKEIDFIVDGKTALEVKSSASPKYIRALQQRSAALKILQAYIVSYQFDSSPQVILATDL